MSKVICEICGTSYPETADQCPICGYPRDLDLVTEEEKIEEEGKASSPAPAEKEPVRGGKFASGNRGRKAAEPVKKPQYDDGDDEEDEDDAHEGGQSNALLVVALILVIAALLAATAFIGVKYVLPNMGVEETSAPSESIAQTQPEETEKPTVPCTNLVLTSGGLVHLEKDGQYWLLNVVVLPVDCTDDLVFTSSDETVATVNSEGRVTAVGQGEAVITISCGEQKLECRIECSFPEETSVPQPDPTEESDVTDPTDNT